MVVYEFEELFANVSGNVLREWWIKPDNLPFALLTWRSLVTVLKFKVVGVARVG